MELTDILFAAGVISSAACIGAVIYRVKYNIDAIRNDRSESDDPEEDSAGKLERFVESDDTDWEVLREFSNLQEGSKQYTDLYYRAWEKVKKYAEDAKAKLLKPAFMLKCIEDIGDEEVTDASMDVAKQILSKTEGLRQNMKQCMAVVKDVFKVSFDDYINTAPENPYK